MNRIRRERIKEYLDDRNIATIKELRELLPDISLMTLHRDLDALEEQGFLAKYRGGVKLVHQMGDMEFSVRLRDNNPGKMQMAQKALSLIEPYNSVFLDAGTSNLVVAKNLPDINLNVVTTSPGIALELCNLSNPMVTMCCGALNRNNQSVCGQNTLEMLKNINIDIAFIGVSGCSADVGFTCGTEADMLVKKLVIEKARTSVLMCGNEKLKRLMPYTFATMKDVDYVITDTPLSDSYMKAAEENGVIIM